ncbi:hypothetical protein [Clostridium sp. 'White wine YQ']|uniref:hypothetical protein n=1 Tax=Clostridium sp. 'White wine YQ' TaxID=3027474 RepID=UPI002365DF5B|nr:hypothetical protein [Clostridium sp. 'White wine YQ']MDD7794022.1 hypothetical protein [Clostridium sp. 'White wine YQ']
MKKIYYFAALIPIIFPIISKEDLIPWAIAIYFIYRSFKKIESLENNIKRKIFTNVMLSGVCIIAFNVVSTLIESYLAKMLL